jgi:hypothetical protein
VIIAGDHARSTIIFRDPILSFMLKNHLVQRFHVLLYNMWRSTFQLL